MKAAKSEGGLSRGRKRNSFFLGTNAGCSPSITYLMLTSRWRKTSVNMLHFTQTCSRHWCSEMQRHLNLPILGQTSPQTILGFRPRVSGEQANIIDTRSYLCLSQQDSQDKRWLSQCRESSWSRDRDGDQPGWTVSDIDYMDVVKGKSPVITQKDCHGQQEDSPWLTKIVQLTDHFCPAGYDSWDKLTVWADSFPKIDFFSSHLPGTRTWAIFFSGFPMGVGCQHFKTCSYR